MKKNRTALIILDGLGLSEDTKGNAVYLANTPTLDMLFKDCPNTILETSGMSVGLPEGQMGNSEVGHTNIGAGRVVYQDLPRITKSIEDGSFFQNKAYSDAINKAIKNKKKVHLLGLLSDGGVHSHIEHIFAFLELAKKYDCNRLYLHMFLDGRDVAPNSGYGFMGKLLAKCDELKVGKVATVQGRFWGMDRDKRWDRLQKGYDAIVRGQGIYFESPLDAIKNSYEQGVFDEFLEPTVIIRDAEIEDGDSVIFINFRPDRAREMTWAISGHLPENADIDTESLDVNYVCTTSYDSDLSLPIAFPPEMIENTLGEYISSLGMKQFRIAETEKYAHVTFFLNGGKELPYEGEDRILVPSSKEYPTYDLIPQMSAEAVTENLIKKFEDKSYSLYVCNYANCDMVGHTGNLEAAIKAVETIDLALSKLIISGKENEITLFITADHGNAEKMINEDGGKYTAHTTNKVPFISTDITLSLRDGGKLADIAPTILDYMGLKKPVEMTGKTLIKS
jgi:2,3-bisphosphoglycerate-independent phosphoglycerate mutase